MSITAIWSRIFSVWFKTVLPLGAFYLGLMALPYLAAWVVEDTGTGFCFGSMIGLGAYGTHYLALFAGYGAIDQYLIDGTLDLGGNWSLALQKFWQMFFGSLVVFGLGVVSVMAADHFHGEVAALAAGVAVSWFAILYVPALLLEAGGPFATVIYTVQLFFKKPVGVVGTMVVYTVVIVIGFAPAIWVGMTSTSEMNLLVALAFGLTVYWTFSWVTGTVLYRALFSKQFALDTADEVVFGTDGDVELPNSGDADGR